MGPFARNLARYSIGIIAGAGIFPAELAEQILHSEVIAQTVEYLFYAGMAAGVEFIYGIAKSRGWKL